MKTRGPSPGIPLRPDELENSFLAECAFEDPAGEFRLFPFGLALLYGEDAEPNCVTDELLMNSFPKAINAIKWN